MYRRENFESRAQYIARLASTQYEEQNKIRLDYNNIENNETTTEEENIDTAMKESTSKEKLREENNSDGSNQELQEKVLLYNNSIRSDDTAIVTDGLINNEMDSQFEFDSDDSIADLNYVLEKDTSSDESTESAVPEPTSVENKKVKKLTRKRTRVAETWTRNKRKMNRNLGHEYISAKGKNIKAKDMKPPCTEKCRLKCASKFSFEERKQIFESYWKLGDINIQRNFLSSCMCSNITPIYRDPKPGSSRSLNLKYTFNKGSEQVQVCKMFFKNTLSINNRTIYTTTNKKDQHGFIEPDKRGKHGNQRRVDEEIMKDIRQHIASFSRISSHYCRAKTNKEYLDGSLNMTIMYKLYKEQCEQKGKPFGKYSMYATVINTETNIAFHAPKKDQCALCENYKNGSEDDKRNIQAKYENHIKEKELSRAEKIKDIESENTGVYCFDLQAVLPCPSGHVSTFFYKRRLATYNFTIFDITNKLGYCYTWHEGLARRGANEISSCVYNFLYNDAAGIENIVFYSDNCVGQNKNKFICSMYLYCIQNLISIKSITHKFLIVGHTQNEGDSMHAAIEKKKKRILKKGPIYVPSQWIMILRGAKKNETPYKVNEMYTTDFFDFKTFSVEMGKNYTVNRNKERVNWNNIKILKVTKENPNSIFYKNSYEEKDFQEIIVQANLRSSKNCRELQLAYKRPPPIAAAKKKNLLELCKENAIKPVYRSFYENLHTEANNVNSSSGSDSN